MKGAWVLIPVLSIGIAGCGDLGEKSRETMGALKEAARLEAEKMLEEKRRAEEQAAAAREERARMEAAQAELARLESEKQEAARQEAGRLAREKRAKVRAARLELVGSGIPELTAPNGRVYRNLTVKKISDLDATFSHPSGVISLRLPDLPEELQAKFLYDAEEYELADSEYEAGKRIQSQAMTEVAQARKLTQRDRNLEFAKQQAELEKQQLEDQIRKTEARISYLKGLRSTKYRERTSSGVRFTRNRITKEIAAIEKEIHQLDGQLKLLKGKRRR